MAERAEDVLGFVAIHSRSCITPERPVAELHEVVVDIGWQRRGIGKALFSRAKEYARKRDAR